MTWANVPPLSERTIQRVLATAHLPASDAAAELGIDVRTLTTYRSRLRRLHGVDVPYHAERQRQQRRDRAWRIEVLLAEGLPTRLIAQRLRCSPGIIRDTLKRERIRITDIRSDDLDPVRSGEALANVFGVDDQTLQRWHRLGWLPGCHNRLSRTSRSRKYFFTDRDVAALLRCREAWTSIQIERITDPNIRAELEHLQAEAGGHWLTPREVGERLGYCKGEINRLIRIGRIPATRIGRRNWIWSADLEEA
jgi:excisionase family DNA binding protein